MHTLLKYRARLAGERAIDPVSIGIINAAVLGVGCWSVIGSLWLLLHRF